MNSTSRLALALAALLLVSGSVVAQAIYPKGTTLWDTSRSYRGFTIFPAGSGEGVLIGNNGVGLHSWTSPVPGERILMIEPLPFAKVLVATGAFINARSVFELDWMSNTLWSYDLPAGMGYIHHDIERLPNGNTLLLCAQTISVPSISSIPLVDDFLLEVDPAGNIVWSWYTYQHFDELGFDQLGRDLIANEGGDWAHTNAVASLPPNSHASPALREGNLIVSQRFTNIVFIIDRQTGDIVWQIGPQDNLTYGQHAPVMIEQGLDGAGNILVFDNGSGTGYPLIGRAPGFASVLEIEPNTESVVWNYNAQAGSTFQALFDSDIVSNAQRLPNGNTLICSGIQGRIFEVTDDYEIVWEYMSPFKNTRGTRLIYRATRVPLTWAGDDPGHMNLRPPSASGSGEQ